MDEKYIATEKCGTCLFKGLCQAAQLEHCEEECYVEEVERV